MIRFFDILISLVGLVILSPVYLIVAVLIFIDSGLPVIFTQNRVGKGGIDFLLFKFRSMHIDTDKQGLITVGLRDPRITRIGYYIRKNKLDELPQLFNVLIGDMSIVGPRPEVRKYVDLYTREQKEILSVRPGITDYASIKFKNENEILFKASNPEDFYVNNIMSEKIKLNMLYIQNQNLFQYFKIILLTLI
jgi:lipopolysaccharide/colanic/teichoic acid biosynthesis glycosyltransferase